MGSNDFEIIIRLIDKLIETAEPRQGEYYRGYREGIMLHRMGGQFLENSYGFKAHKDSGDHYLDNYVRGFNDGSTNVLPESLSGLLDSIKTSQ